MVKRVSMFFLAVIVIIQMFTLSVFASGVEARINLDLEAKTVTVEVNGLPENRPFSLMAYYNGELDYLNQYTADEKGEATFTYPSGKQWATLGEIKILINGVEFNQTIVPVEGVTISGGSALTLIKHNATLELTAKVLPDNAADKRVTWISLNPAVATVTDGVVKGVSRGLAIIKVATVDGGFGATLIIRVV